MNGLDRQRVLEGFEGNVEAFIHDDFTFIENNSLRGSLKGKGE
jgi:hypothetical protein